MSSLSLRERIPGWTYSVGAGVTEVAPACLHVLTLFPDTRAPLRETVRLAQPLLVFVSIKGKEEAFLLAERMASSVLHPVAQCSIFTEEPRAAVRHLERCSRTRELS